MAFLHSNEIYNIAYCTFIPAKTHPHEYLYTHVHAHSECSIMNNHKVIITFEQPFSHYTASLWLKSTHIELIAFIPWCHEYAIKMQALHTALQNHQYGAPLNSGPAFASRVQPKICFMWVMLLWVRALENVALCLQCICFVPSHCSRHPSTCRGDTFKDHCVKVNLTITWLRKHFNVAHFLAAKHSFFFLNIELSR